MNATALQKSNRIIPAVISVCLAAFVQQAAALPGDFDLTFGGTGRVTTAISSRDDSGKSVVIQSDGKIVVVGISWDGLNNDFALGRYNVDGALDASFNGTGKVTAGFGPTNNDEAYSVAVQADGNIVVAGFADMGGSGNGTHYDFALARYESYADNDGDCVPDRYETGTGFYVSLENTGTSPTNPDSDGDGLSDGQEVNTWDSDPNVADTDSDGFADGFEVSPGFNPTSNSSTPDAFSSVRTAVEYRFAAASGVSYRIESSDDLVQWSTIETNIRGTGTAITRFYSTERQPKRYFRSRRN